MPPGSPLLVARGAGDAAAWAEAAEDARPRVAVLVVAHDDDVEERLTALEDLLGEELAETAVVLHDDDERPVEVLDLLETDGPYELPSEAVDALTDAMLACTLDEALVQRWQLGLGLSPATLRAAVLDCVRQGLLPVVVPVIGDPPGPGHAALQSLLAELSR